MRTLSFPGHFVQIVLWHVRHEIHPHQSFGKMFQKPSSHMKKDFRMIGTDLFEHRLFDDPQFASSKETHCRSESTPKISEFSPNVKLRPLIQGFKDFLGRSLVRWTAKKLQPGSRRRSTPIISAANRSVRRSVGSRKYRDHSEEAASFRALMNEPHRSVAKNCSLQQALSNHTNRPQPEHLSDAAHLHQPHRPNAVGLHLSLETAGE